MNKHIFAVASVAVLSVCCSLSVYAEGGYFGASVGSTSPEGSGFESDTGFKITGGYKYTERLAIEGSYVSLGEFAANNDTLSEISSMTGFSVTSSSVEISGFEFSIVGLMPVNERFSFFGRVGVFMWDADVNVSISGYGSGSESDDGADFIFGLGLSYDLTEKLALKAEYSGYDALDSDVDYFGIGLDFNF